MPVVVAAHDAGLVDIGENYAQELVAKAEAPEVVDRPDIRWHAIGRLQRNKVRLLAPYVTLWQAVDRLALGTEIARRAAGARVLVQVNVSGEDQKGGCATRRDRIAGGRAPCARALGRGAHGCRLGRRWIDRGGRVRACCAVWWTQSACPPARWA